MSSVKIQGNASGSGQFTVASPNSNNTRTATLPDADGNVVLDTATQTLTNKTLSTGLVMGASPITAGTAVTLASPQTSVDFSIPSWAKTIFVMIHNLSVSGTANPVIQIGDAGGIETTGYFSVTGGVNTAGTAAATQSSTAYVLQNTVAATDIFYGLVQLANISGNIWVLSGNMCRDSTNDAFSSASGSKTLSDTLTTVRITTSGADTIDTGTILNVLYA